MKITTTISYIAIFISLSFVVIGQIFIKRGSAEIEFDFKKLFLTFKNILTDRNLLTGLFFTLLAPFFYFIALKNIDLSIAFGMNSLNYFFVSIAGWVIWKEKITSSKAIGLLLIIIGVLLISLGK